MSDPSTTRPLPNDPSPGRGKPSKPRARTPAALRGSTLLRQQETLARLESSFAQGAARAPSFVGEAYGSPGWRLKRARSGQQANVSYGAGLRDAVLPGFLATAVGLREPVIDVSGCSLEPSDVVALLHVIGECPTVTGVDLRGTRLPRMRATVADFVAACRRNPGLWDIRIDDRTSLRPSDRAQLLAVAEAHRQVRVEKRRYVGHDAHRELTTAVSQYFATVARGLEDAELRARLSLENEQVAAWHAARLQRAEAVRAIRGHERAQVTEAALHRSLGTVERDEVTARVFVATAHLSETLTLLHILWLTSRTVLATEETQRFAEAKAARAVERDEAKRAERTRKSTERAQVAAVVHDEASGRAGVTGDAASGLDAMKAQMAEEAAVVGATLRRQAEQRRREENAQRRHDTRRTQEAQASTEAEAARLTRQHQSRREDFDRDAMAERRLLKVAGAEFQVAVGVLCRALLAPALRFSATLSGTAQHLVAAAESGAPCLSFGPAPSSVLHFRGTDPTRLLPDALCAAAMPPEWDRDVAEAVHKARAAAVAATTARGALLAAASRILSTVPTAETAALAAQCTDAAASAPWSQGTGGRLRVDDADLEVLVQMLGSGSAEGVAVRSVFGAVLDAVASLPVGVAVPGPEALSAARLRVTAARGDVRDIGRPSGDGKRCCTLPRSELLLGGLRGKGRVSKLVAPSLAHLSTALRTAVVCCAVAAEDSVIGVVECAVRVDFSGARDELRSLLPLCPAPGPPAEVIVRCTTHVGVALAPSPVRLAGGPRSFADADEAHAALAAVSFHPVPVAGLLAAAAHAAEAAVAEEAPAPAAVPSVPPFAGTTLAVEVGPPGCLGLHEEVDVCWLQGESLWVDPSGYTECAMGTVGAPSAVWRGDCWEGRPAARWCCTVGATSTCSPSWLRVVLRHVRVGAESGVPLGAPLEVTMAFVGGPTARLVLGAFRVPL